MSFVECIPPQLVAAAQRDKRLDPLAGSASIAFSRGAAMGHLAPAAPRSISLRPPGLKRFSLQEFPPMSNRRRQIYEGKAKILYEGPEPGTLIQYFKDDATAFNAQKKGTINGKGVINNRISEYVFTRLAHIGIPTHFIRRLNMREQLVRQVEIIPL
jgi:hypothetical protein